MRRASLDQDSRGRLSPGYSLADDQDFADVVAGEEEFDVGEIAEEVFDVAVVEYALQAEFACRASLFSIATSDVLHLEDVTACDVVAIAWGIRAGFLSVEKGKQHASGFQQRPEATDHRFYQALVKIVGQVPAEHDIKLRSGINQVFVEEAFTVKDRFTGLVFGGK